MPITPTAVYEKKNRNLYEFPAGKVASPNELNSSVKSRTSIFNKTEICTYPVPELLLQMNWIRKPCFVHPQATAMIPAAKQAPLLPTSLLSLGHKYFTHVHTSFTNLACMVVSIIQIQRTSTQKKKTIKENILKILVCAYIYIRVCVCRERRRQCVCVCACARAV